MKNFLISHFVQFIKKETVFCVAFACAAASAFFIYPSKSYISYIDFNTLAMLFCLMTVVAGLEQCGVFKLLGQKLCSHVSSVRALSAVLVFLPFVISMFITNDVSLITFVPFALLLLRSQKNIQPWHSMYVVVLQTVAANTGSMLTPIGNPQNLFLYGKAGMGVGPFMLIMLPYTIMCAVMLALSLMLLPKTRLESAADGIRIYTDVQKKRKPSDSQKNHDTSKSLEKSSVTKIRIVIYAVLFVCCLLAVIHIIPKLILVPLVLAAVLIADRKVLLSVDYVLLFTFIAFFIFTGNMSSVPQIRTMLESLVQNHECIAGIAASQIISNVPAALLLYPFASDVRGLLTGVNIGGLGTLVASLASLISYKLYMRQTGKGGAYLGIFTLVNIIYLVILIVLYKLIS
jgi:Na+/H+ antiporter NhaD/arsenite permease-like protein